MTAFEPRYVRTIEDLEALPVGAVLVDPTHHAWVKGTTQWWSSHPYDADHLNNPLKMADLIVVYDPDLRARMRRDAQEG